MGIARRFLLHYAGDVVQQLLCQWCLAVTLGMPVCWARSLRPCAVLLVVDPGWLHCLPLQINCGSIAPITASQFGTNRLMEKLLLQRSGKQELGTMGRFGCAAVAGTVSALIATPTELVIIQQQVRPAASAGS